MRPPTIRSPEIVSRVHWSLPPPAAGPLMPARTAACIVAAEAVVSPHRLAARRPPTMILRPGAVPRSVKSKSVALRRIVRRRRRAVKAFGAQLGSLPPPLAELRDAVLDPLAHALQNMPLDLG